MDSGSDEEELEDEETSRKRQKVKVNVSRPVPAPQRGPSAEVYAEIDDDDLEGLEAAVKDVEGVRKGDEDFVALGRKNLRELQQEERGGAGPSKKSSAKAGRKSGRK